MATAFSSKDQLRIVLLGDSGTGKDSYVRRLTDNTFPNGTNTDKECAVISIKVQTDQDSEISLQIFNIAGLQRGKTRIKEYFKNIHGCIIMFDVTRAETFDNVLGWSDDMRNVNKSTHLCCMLLANKCDCQKDEGLGDMMNDMENYCEAVGFCCYFEVSNKDNTNVERSIQTLIREIIKRKASLTTTTNGSPSQILMSLDRPIPLQDRKQEYILKVLVIGEGNTGKTALIRRYVSNTFSGKYRSTVGADLAVRKVQYNQAITIDLHIWDIAGEERFGDMTRVFYKNAAGCLIVFDVSAPLSLTNGAVRWKVDFDKKVNASEENQVPCLLIGNKCDLKDEGGIVTEEVMREFCQTHQFIHWLVTSAKENINIGKAFSLLLDEMMKNIDNGNAMRKRSSDVITASLSPSLSRNATNCCYS